MADEFAGSVEAVGILDRLEDFGRRVKELAGRSKGTAGGNGFEFRNEDGDFSRLERVFRAKVVRQAVESTFQLQIILNRSHNQPTRKQPCPREPTRIRTSGQ